LWIDSIALLSMLCWLTIAPAHTASHGQLSSAVQRGWQPVASTECGFLVHAPRGWTTKPVKPDPGQEGLCQVGLRPPGWSERRERSKYDVAEFAVYVEVAEGTLEDSCEKGFVCRNGNEWYFEGRAGTRSKGHEIRTPMGRGVRGEAETGVYLKEGGYVGAAEAYVAVVNRGHRIVRFVADHEFQDKRVFDQIVQTFEFSTAVKAR
jgi:hypothetical protein